MSEAAIRVSPVTILASAIDRQRRLLTKETAAFLLSLELSPQHRILLDQLAEKARRGTLTAAEQNQMDDYMQLGRLVEVLKAKARFAMCDE